LLPDYDAEVLTQNRELSDYFETVCKGIMPVSYKTASNWIMTEVLRILNEENTGISGFWIKGENLASLLNLIAEGKISNNIAKEVYSQMLEVKDPDDKKQDPGYIVKEKNLLQLTDSSEIEKIVRKVIEENPKEAERYKSGEIKLLALFVGKVMKESKGKANPKVVNDLIIKNLEHD
jgi:aspartyl-tRNA(Asn)/glutamyl-tRNA(Gln) amidotransferase subunit B